MNSNRFKNHSKKVISTLIIILLLAIIFITEFLLGPAPVEGESRCIRLREHKPNAVNYFTPDELYMSKSEELHQKAYKLEIDDQGYISPSVIHSDPDLSIIFLGGSTTECIYIDEDQRFPYLTGRLLEKEGRKVNSINSGVSGNNSRHSIDILLNKGLKINPDIAVMMHNINDLNILLYEKDYSNNNPYRSLIIKEDKNTFSYYVKGLTKCIIPNLYRRISLFNRRYVNVRIDDEFAHLRGKRLTIDRQNIFRKFKKSLLTFIAVSKANGIIPVLMTQANRFKENPDSIIIANWTLEDDFGIKYDDYRDIFVAMNKLIRDVGVSNNVLVLDLDGEIPKTSGYMYDAVHFNNKGSCLASKIIAEHLNQIIDNI